MEKKQMTKVLENEIEKIINVLVIMELAKQINIPTPTYDLTSVRGQYQLKNILGDEEKLLTFDQVINGCQSRATYLISLGFVEEKVNELEMLFNKMAIFSYVAGFPNYESNHGLITDGINFRVAPLFSKENALSKQLLPFSSSLINNMGLQSFEKLLKEIAETLDIKTVYQKLEDIGIAIPDNFAFEQIAKFNYNYSNLNNELLDRRENEMYGYYDATIHSTK